MMRTAAPIGLSFALFAALFFFSSAARTKCPVPRRTPDALLGVRRTPRSPRSRRARAPRARASAAPGRRANILLLLTDDQDYLLESTRREHMPLLRAKVADAGVHVEYAFATTPECCPSRASILTGRFVHNTHVVNNTASGNCASVLWRAHGRARDARGAPAAAQLLDLLRGQVHERVRRAARAARRGSRASTSRWATTGVPPGWDAWFGTGPETLIAGAGGGDNGDVLYWNFTVSDNGEPRELPRGRARELRDPRVGQPQPALAAADAASSARGRGRGGTGTTRPRPGCARTRSS